MPMNPTVMGLRPRPTDSVMPRPLRQLRLPLTYASGYCARPIDRGRPVATAKSLRPSGSPAARLGWHSSVMGYVRLHRPVSVLPAAKSFGVPDCFLIYEYIVKNAGARALLRNHVDTEEPQES